MAHNAPPPFATPPPFTYKPGGFGNPLKPGAPTVPENTAGKAYAGPLKFSPGAAPQRPAFPASGGPPANTEANQGTQVGQKPVPFSPPKQGPFGASTPFVPGNPVGKNPAPIGPPPFLWTKPSTTNPATEANAEKPAVPQREEAAPYSQGAQGVLAPVEKPVSEVPKKFGSPPEFKGFGGKLGFGVVAAGTDEARPGYKAAPPSFLPQQAAVPPSPQDPSQGSNQPAESPRPKGPPMFAPAVFGRSAIPKPEIPNKEDPPKTELLKESTMEETNALGPYGLPGKLGPPKFGPKTGISTPQAVIISSKESAEKQEPLPKPAQEEPSPKRFPKFGAAPNRDLGPFAKNEEAKKEEKPREAPFAPITGALKPVETNPAQENREQASVGPPKAELAPFGGMKGGPGPIAKPAFPPSFPVNKSDASNEPPQVHPPTTKPGSFKPFTPFKPNEANKAAAPTPVNQLPSPPQPIATPPIAVAPVSSVPEEEKRPVGGRKNVPPFPMPGFVPAVWRTASMVYPAESPAVGLEKSASLKIPLEQEEAAIGPPISNPPRPQEIPFTPPPVLNEPAKVSKPEFPPQALRKPDTEEVKPPELPKPPVAAPTVPVTPPWGQPTPQSFKPATSPFQSKVFGSQPLAPAPQIKPPEQSNFPTTRAAEVGSGTQAVPSVKPPFMTKETVTSSAKPPAEVNLGPPSNKWGPQDKWGPPMPFQQPIGQNSQKPSVISVTPAVAAQPPPFLTKPGPNPLATNSANPAGPQPFTPIKKTDEAPKPTQAPPFASANPIGKPAFMQNKLGQPVSAFQPPPPTANLPPGPFQSGAPAQISPPPSLFPPKVMTQAPVKPGTLTPPWLASKSGLKAGPEASAPQGQPILAVAKPGERPPFAGAMPFPPGKPGLQPFK